MKTVDSVSIFSNAINVAVKSQVGTGRQYLRIMFDAHEFFFVGFDEDQLPAIDTLMDGLRNARAKIVNGL